MKKSLKELLSVLLSGGTLNPLEAAEIAGFDPDAVKNELLEARKKIEEYESAKLSREELMQKELAALTAERDSIKSDRDKLLRSNRINAIAAESGCDEPEYLDFLAHKAGVDLNDAGAVAGFIAEAEKANPHCFRTSLRPGGGSGVPSPSLPQQEIESSGGTDRIERLIFSLCGAPTAE